MPILCSEQYAESDVETKIEFRNALIPLALMQVKGIVSRIFHFRNLFASLNSHYLDEGMENSFLVGFFLVSTLSMDIVRLKYKDLRGLDKSSEHNLS